MRNDHIRAIIGKNIKGLRTEKRISQEDLAGYANADRSYISLIERGKNEPSVSKLFAICKGLGIKPSMFINLIETEYNKLNTNKDEDGETN
ncbi:helix-turn-helix domain-containing protein [Alkalihalophilus marmarensis]|nr:helix-turn-helix transcriptional regulator [Alkalihalophilus marmarensis]